MKKNFFFSMAVMVAIVAGSLQKVKAQSSWLVGGNTALQDLSIGQIGANGLSIITSNVPRIYVASTGNVGIGTTTPWSSGGTNAKICQLAATQYPQYLLQATSGSTDNKVWRMIARSTHDFEIQTLSDNYGTEQTAMQINRNANLISTVVFPNGNVGIGTTSPGTKLDMLGGSWDLSSNEGDFRIGTPTYRMKIGVSTAGGGAGDVRMRAAGGTGRLMLGSNTLDVLTINGAGYVGIGNTSPQAMLDVNGDAHINGLTVGRGGGNSVYNSAFGNMALHSNTTGGGNTAIGSNALYSNTTGSNNTALGNYAYPIDGTVSNYTGIGYNVGGSTSTSNEVEIGNTSVSVIRGEVNFSTYSDKRIKNTIQQNVPGLAFINKLTPVTYKLDIHKENDMIYAGKTVNDKSEKDADFAGKYDLEKKQMTGFLAQDVEAAAEAVHYDFSGVVKPRNDHDLYSLRYSDFVVPLVKAVQELSKTNDSLKTQNQQLIARLDKIEAMLSQQGNAITTNNATVNKQSILLTSAAALSQNIPNPFSHSTSISYSLPSGSSNATISFYDANGTMLKSEKLAGNGTGNITLQASDLPAGVYRYALFADGRMIDSKQMMISK